MVVCYLIWWIDLKSQSVNDPVAIIETHNVQNRSNFGRAYSSNPKELVEPRMDYDDPLLTYGNEFLTSARQELRSPKRLTLCKHKK